MMWDVKETGRYDSGSVLLFPGFKIGITKACLNIVGILPCFIEAFHSVHKGLANTSLHTLRSLAEIPSGPAAALESS